MHVRMATDLVYLQKEQKPVQAMSDKEDAKKAKHKPSQQETASRTCNEDSKGKKQAKSQRKHASDTSRNRNDTISGRGQSESGVPASSALM